MERHDQIRLFDRPTCAHPGTHAPPALLRKFPITARRASLSRGLNTWVFSRKCYTYTVSFHCDFLDVSPFFLGSLENALQFHHSPVGAPVTKFVSASLGFC